MRPNPEKMKAIFFSALILFSGVGGVGYSLNKQDEYAVKLQKIEAEYKKANTQLKEVKEEKEKIELKLAEIKSRVIIHPLEESDKAYTTRPFGSQKHPVYGYTRNHNGLDFGSTNKFNRIQAVANGRVIAVGYDHSGGWNVAIDHGDYITKYMHLRYNPARGYHGTQPISKGDTITAGTVFGVMGNTGESSTATHLHFEIHAFNPESMAYEPVDPNSGKFIYLDNPKFDNQIAAK